MPILHSLFDNAIDFISPNRKDKQYLFFKDLTFSQCFLKSYSLCLLSIFIASLTRKIPLNECSSTLYQPLMILYLFFYTIYFSPQDNVLGNS